MREIVFDTETTGLDPKSGDKLVEIGAVELINHMPTGVTYHQYINPEREVPEDAYKVHGLNLEFLKNYPTFRDIAKEWMDFVGDDGILVAHNASFDMSFINHELQGCGYPVYEWDRVIDTLEIARQKFPHSKVNLDALCKRFGVDNTSRTLHGALLDAQLLAEVYLELLGGQEPSMQLGENAHRDSAVAKTVSAQSLKRQFRPARDFPLSAEDLAAHEDFMTNKIKDSVWNASLETAPAESE